MNRATVEASAGRSTSARVPVMNRSGAQRSLGRPTRQVRQAEPRRGELAAVWGVAVPTDRPPRVLGIFAHPDDEVFCVGGTIALCAAAGADTAIVSLTRGEAGQIRDGAVATRRTLGTVRLAELDLSAGALGVQDVTCLDLGDGRLAQQPLVDVARTAWEAIERFRPDVVVTFGPDGAYGHPDHVTSCLATVQAVRSMAEPPRLLHAQFPLQEQLLVDLIVEWLTSKEQRFSGTAAFGHALKLFADGSSMLGFAADRLAVEWFPAGSFIIEQGDQATRLFCILSGSVDIVIEDADGRMHQRDTVGAGCFVGEDGLATGRLRNAHVIARENVTCLVLAPDKRSVPAGAGAPPTDRPVTRLGARPDGVLDDPCFSVDVRATLDRKITALTAHRSQYALDADLLPHPMLESLLGTEYFTVVDAAGAVEPAR